MTLLAIELNDAGIRAAKDTDPGTEALPASPGVALWDGDRLLTGREASRRARLKPRWSHDRFWEELDTTPLPAPFPRSLRRADLAHAHLEDIWRSLKADVDEVILAVPGSFSREQLALILGIARSCGMKVTGVVDGAVAACALATQHSTLVHLDLHRHRTIATKLRRGEVLEREHTAADERSGLVELMDGWVKLITQAFVRTTRFDPLHRGETEQALYLRLPEWLDELSQKESTVMTMEGNGKEYAIELTREQLVRSAEPSYRRIGQLARSSQRPGERAALVLSRSLADLPGLVDFLGNSDGEIVPLPAAAAATGALQMKEWIRSAGDEEAALPFITRLPRSPYSLPGRAWSTPPPIDAPRPSRRGETSATHVLCNGVAHPITSQPLVLGLEIPAGSRGIDLSGVGGLAGSTAGISRSHCSIYRLDDLVWIEDHSSYGSFLNDQRVEGKATLAAGDRLRLGTPGIELQLIQLADSNGTSPD